MCGIVGLFQHPAGLGGRRAIINSMSKAIRHRGPDDHGDYIDGHIALGIQRLKVVDLVTGHQPMTTPDGVRIVFNGEIFNHRDVRAELEGDGESFKTQSDTEVVLRQYHRHGLAGFHALNGMFAAAIWDTRSGELHLIRDRMGVKPLYYFWDGKWFAFGSEIKALLEVPGLERTIEPQAIWNYLTFRYVPGPQTIWRKIHKIPPAHHLTIGLNGGPPRLTRWWDIPFPDADRAVGPCELTREFGALFTDAVQRRMVADVPVGIMLSGGIDSSAVAAVAAQGQGRPLKTFSVAFRDSPDADERAYARQVASHLGTEHQEIEIGEREFIDFLPEFVHCTDEPLADLASVPLYYVSRLARQKVAVALSGEGADEILAGYDFDRWLTARPQAKPDPDDVRKDAVPPHMTNLMDSDMKRNLFATPQEFPDSLDLVRQQLVRAGPRSPLDQMLFLYCQDWLVEDLLMKADKMSMAHSLELRTPFLDYRLVEWAAQAPLGAKVGPGADGKPQTKRVLRDFMKGRLPSGILTRPKQGFPVPAYSWLSSKLASWAKDTLLDRQSRLGGWFDLRVRQELLDQGTQLSANPAARARVWNLLILEIWMRRWLS